MFSILWYINMTWQQLKAKSFDKVPHQKLLLKLARYGITGKVFRWMEAFLTQRKQRVVIDGKCSDWVNVESSVPQGTVTGPIDFLVFINDLPKNLTSSVKLFADDCIVFRKIAGPEDAGMLQKDLDALTAWQSKSEMNIPKEIWSSVPDPLLSTIDCILGLTQLCRLSSPAAVQVAWSCCREVGQYYIKSVENSKIAKHTLPPWIFYEPDLSKCTSFVTQFIT